jgi:tRNA modification GTPase
VSDETIAAIATAPGPGGIGIIRLSGDRALAIGVLLTGITPIPRHAHFCALHDKAGQKLDTGVFLFFPGPNSFILDLILREVCQLGARIARPGEFSHRAYLNNKIDLAQAEAIADLINASTQQAALNASRTLQGVFSHKINVLVDLITNLRVYVEAAIDFPEEEIDFMKNNQVEERLEEIIRQLDAVRGEAKQGSIIQEGMKVVIAGKPNAGKSSLLNALSGEDTAIVSSIEGTTRDVLRTQIQIDGMPLHIVDTAGLRDSRDEIEQEGIRRAWAEIETADRILLVVDSTAPDEGVTRNSIVWQELDQLMAKDIPVLVIENKCDLLNRQPGIEHNGDSTTIHLSAKTGTGIDLLRKHLKSCMGYSDSGEGKFSARRRHLVALDQAGQYLSSGQQQLLETGAGELLAEDLRLCQNCLSEITDGVSSDELLGKIFSSFCIGK